MAATDSGAGGARVARPSPGPVSPEGVSRQARSGRTPVVGRTREGLADMILQNLGQAMQGLAVVPLLAGYDAMAPEGARGRIFTGGPYEKYDFHAEGSGSPYAPGALKKLYHSGMSRHEAALAALYDAADDDSATGGPDINRRIFPSVSLITEGGFERLSEPETEELSQEMVGRRHRRPDGPNAAP
ncbi:hypothetical protein ACWGKK_36000 [Streptomyces chartreusis]